MYRDAYLETEILSASPVRLVELLYRGAMEAVRQALGALERSDIAGRNRQITRVQAILAELILSLDHERGGGLSRALVELYDYMQRRLNEANSAQSAEPLHEVQKLLETLLGAWTSVSSAVAFDGPAHAMARNQSASQFGAIDFESVGVDSVG